MRTFLLGLAVALVAPLALAGDVGEFLGRWALDLPGGAGWLEIRQEAGYLDGSILWYGGSVVPVDSVYLDEDELVVTRVDKVERKDKDGNVLRTQQFTETIEIEVKGDSLEGERERPRNDGEGVDATEFTGKRIPDLPPAPDLSKVTYGDAIQLLDANSLKGWSLTDPKAKNGWSVKDGMLTNDPTVNGKKAHGFGNLRTDAEFEDFNLTCDVRVIEEGNSGIYLRGIYEVQVEDSYGKPLDSHNMGAVYSRETPLVSAEKPHGEWQTYDITLCDRHLTVMLNGQLIHDNVPMQGCTGGALWSDEFRPGPIYLQGDHTGVDYKNIELRPILK